jgi:hypothetical protein
MIVPRIYGYNPTIDGNVFTNFAQVMRYIGGSAEAVDQNFLTAPAHADGIFANIAMPHDPNPDATLANFLQFGHGADPLEVFGGANMDGLNQLREIITNYYPDAARFLQSIRPAAAGHLMDDDTNLLAEILTGADTAASIAVFNGTIGNISTMNDAQIDAALLAFRNGTLAEIRKSSENGRPSFGACPHMAIKLRWYLSDLDGVFYLKAGFVRQSGVARFDNGLAPKSFHKISGLVGLGAEKNLEGNLSVALEVLKILKTKNNIGSVRILGKNVEQRVKLHDTRVSMSLIYNI